MSMITYGIFQHDDGRTYAMKFASGELVGVSAPLKPHIFNLIKSMHPHQVMQRFPKLDYDTSDTTCDDVCTRQLEFTFVGIGNFEGGVLHEAV
jgi:hypothetical protein